MSEANLLTIFTMPKAFTGHFAMIQENAIRSWTLLNGTDRSEAVRIILFGADPGTKEAAHRFDLEHVPGVDRNEYGTPLLNDLFRQASALAQSPLVCYVNADIILMPTFIEAVKRVFREKQRFLMVGQRTDMEVNKPLEFGPDWAQWLGQRAIVEGSLHRPTGIDYFVYNRFLWHESAMPAFAIGRFSWDNWLIFKALEMKAPVIDATSQVVAIHQNHDYSHAVNGAKGARTGPEAKHNLELAGGMKQSLTIWDSTHVLTEDGRLMPRPKAQVEALGGGIWSYRRNNLRIRA